MRFARLVLLLLFVAPFCADNEARASTRPPSGDGHELAAIYYDFSGITCVYVKASQFVFWFEHGGRPDPTQPMPGFARVGDNDPNDLPDYVSVVCDGNEVFKQESPYKRMPRDVVETIGKSRAAVVTARYGSGKVITQALTDGDRANLLSLARWGTRRFASTPPARGEVASGARPLTPTETVPFNPRVTPPGVSTDDPGRSAFAR